MKEYFPVYFGKIPVYFGEFPDYFGKLQLQQLRRKSGIHP